MGENRTWRHGVEKFGGRPRRGEYWGGWIVGKGVGEQKKAMGGGGGKRHRSNI